MYMLKVYIWQNVSTQHCFFAQYVCAIFLHFHVIPYIQIRWRGEPQPRFSLHVHISIYVCA